MLKLIVSKHSYDGHVIVSIEPRTLRVEDTIEITSLRRTPFRVPNAHTPILYMYLHSEPLKSGQPLYKGQNV